MTNLEDLIYQLETLASYERSDIDFPQFEVWYENEQGVEGAADVCCIDLASRALIEIKLLQSKCEG